LDSDENSNLPKELESGSVGSTGLAMDIGKRLRDLRVAKGFSQSDVEKRTGLLRCYLSRVECGHTVPQLATVETWGKALSVTLSEVFAETELSPKPIQAIPLTDFEKRLFKCLKRMSETDRRLILSVALKMANQVRKYDR
jgi:transcriptional regulator with XRE-family HTH domain